MNAGRHAGRRSERGATAVLAAVLAVVLVGLSAFTLDFGRAYLSKRQLQAGADAGSLAAAQLYATKRGSCEYLTTDSPTAANDKLLARGKAASILAENREGASIDSFEIRCNDQDELTVDMSVTGSTPAAFGGVYGTKSITTQRQAQATLEVATGGGRLLRPYMICSRNLPSPVPSGVVKTSFPGEADSDGPCPTANNPGNWWTVNCPEDFSNSNSTLAENTVNGCSSPVSLVKPQPVVEEDPADNADLTAALLAGCVGGPDKDCLNAVTGNINGSEIWDAWRTLLGKTILVPVFCGDTTCDPAAVTPRSGNNVNYPVHKFAAVTVCGFHWGSGDQKTGIAPLTGDCAGNTYGVSDGDNSDNYLLLKYTQVLVSGSTVDGDCPLDDPRCDGGARQVRLTQ